jgi:hypothetical protein
MSNTKAPVCPSCKTNDTLSAKVEVYFEMDWKAGRNEYYITNKYDEYNTPSSPDLSTTCNCGNCGWEGEFSELIKPTTRYTVTLHVDTEEDMTTDVMLGRIRHLLRNGAMHGGIGTDKLTVVSVTTDTQGE